MTDLRPTFEAAFEAHRRHLWSILYRMTGSAADADDLVQDTFARALERPPARLDAVRPWLVRVAMNLGRDHLRRRRRRPYVGPWLPSPIESDELEPPSFEVELPSGVTTEARYDLLESVTFAFLLALEALSPAQRAVLILRDVFDYSVKETAEALALTEANVKTTHHRARRAMTAYENNRARPSVELRERSARVLGELFGHLVSQDVGAIEALLAEDVRATSDGGGEFHAALRTIYGRRKVRLFFQKLTVKRGLPTWFDVRTLNGLPAAIAEYSAGKPGDAKRIAILPILGSDGRIREIHAVLASRKLRNVRFASQAESP
jgi:RNA polymerase sigma factor (sigma-70 family)